MRSVSRIIHRNARHCHWPYSVSREKGGGFQGLYKFFEGNKVKSYGLTVKIEFCILCASKKAFCQIRSHIHGQAVL